MRTSIVEAFCLYTLLSVHHTRFIPQSPYSMDREVSAVCESLPKSSDMYTDGSRCGIGFRTPDIVHELVSGENLVRVGQELIKQIEFFLRKNRFVTMDGYGQCIIVKNSIPYL